MDYKQIDELNKLLENHGSTLTSFYDEGIRYGTKKGLIYGAVASFIGISVIVVFDRLKSQNKKESKEESQQGLFLFIFAYFTTPIMKGE